MRYGSYRRRSQIAVPILIGANVLLFIATTADPDLIFSLGLQPSSLEERPWTMLTSLFVHGGLGHIIANMFTFYFFGSYLAGLVGQRGFLVVYFLGGMMGNMLFILLAPPDSIGIGASGAVFAVGTGLAVLRPKLSVIVFPIPVPIPLWIALAGGFLIVSFFPNVAWQAHLGGVLFGLAGGFYFRNAPSRPLRR